MATSRISDPELHFLADRNLFKFSRVSALWDASGEVVVRDDMQLTAAGHRFPVGAFNCLHALGAADRSRARAWLAQAAAFFTERGRGFTVSLRGNRDSALADCCSAAGMRASAAAPGMVLDAPVTAAALPPGVRIERVRDVHGLGEFVSVVAPAFALLSFPEAVTRALFGDAERVLTPDVLCYIAYLDGQPAATTLTLLSHGIAGLYWIGTRPELQRRGLADAITRFASNDAFERGAATVVLQASPYGAPVYRRIGYREFTQYGRYYITREELAASTLLK